MVQIYWIKSDGFNEINWTKLDQIGSNWIKLDQTRSNRNKLVQMRSNWIKREQVGSNHMKLVHISSYLFLDIQSDEKIEIGSN